MEKYTKDSLRTVCHTDLGSSRLLMDNFTKASGLKIYKKAGAVKAGVKVDRAMMENSRKD